LPDAAFDVVTSFDVLYHAWVSDDRAAVVEMARVLRRGGLLLVRVPALKMLWGAHDVAVQSRHRYTRAELVALLEGCGFDVIRATYCNSLLFPLLLARRTLDRLLGREGSDVGFLPAPLSSGPSCARCAPRPPSSAGGGPSPSARASWPWRGKADSLEDTRTGRLRRGLVFLLGDSPHPQVARTAAESR
jgi:hypothetical protein